MRFNLVGPAYNGRHIGIDGTECVNLYVEKNGPKLRLTSVYLVHLALNYWVLQGHLFRGVEGCLRRLGTACWLSSAILSMRYPVAMLLQSEGSLKR